ncbi:hypothetical protein [Cytobacillus pseudoceanisediminis]|uniref:hypothetical protein n=1 Tax=Cytobacillus pseudoceanisediminis TaxID=3051614 RepID=UPI003CEC8A29
MYLKKETKEMLKSLEQDYVDLIPELRQFFSKSYIKRLEPMAPRPKNLIGQNSIVFIQANLFRSKMLVSGYIDGLNNKNPLTTTILVRALYETTGALAYYLKKYNQYLAGELSEEGLNKYLYSLYLGIRDKGPLTEAPDPIGVMSLIDAVDHYLKAKYQIRDSNFRENYEALSEICHPNSFGYMLSHKIDKSDNHTVKFRGETEPYLINTFSIWYFDICSRLYQQIYSELRLKVEKNEELPFKEYRIGDLGVNLQT